MIQIEQQHLGKRLDSFLLNSLRENGIHSFSRSFLQEHWGELISVNGKYLKSSYKFREGDQVEIEFEKIKAMEEKLSNSSGIQSEEGSLDIVFENENFIIINKPKGMVVHPGIGNTENTLANIVKGYLEKKGEFDNGLNRAGIVHRLDRGVSGLIVFAKNVRYQQYLQKLFEEHSVKKMYLAKIEKDELGDEIKDIFPSKLLDIQKEIDTLVNNHFVCDNSWQKLEGYIKRSEKSRVKMKFTPYKSSNGKYALSFMKPISDEDILIKIHTGRMHQIRVSLDYLGIHIKGDTLYGASKKEVMPDKIELQSIFLSFEDMNGEVFSFSKF